MFQSKNILKLIWLTEMEDWDCASGSKREKLDKSRSLTSNVIWIKVLVALGFLHNPGISLTRSFLL